MKKLLIGIGALLMASSLASAVTIIDTWTHAGDNWVAVSLESLTGGFGMGMNGAFTELNAQSSKTYEWGGGATLASLSPTQAYAIYNSSSGASQTGGTHQHYYFFGNAQSSAGSDGNFLYVERNASQATTFIDNSGTQWYYDTYGSAYSVVFKEKGSTTVPEPTLLGMFALTLLGLGRRKRS